MCYHVCHCMLFSSPTQNMVLIVKAHALTTQNLAFVSVSKPFLLKEKHDAIIDIFQQFCFTFHLHTDFTTKFPDLNK